MSEGAPEPEPSAGRAGWRNRFGLAGAALLGAAVVGLGWLTLGGGDSGSVASFQVGSGVPPVVFLYLDNVHIASYLAQLQGGAATSEVLSRQASVTKNASVGSSGVGAGGSTSEQSTAELSLTVNDQSRFTNLLGLLQADGFLHTVDMAARDPEIKREFAAVPDGAFVKLTNCTLSLPNYVQAEEAWRATGGRMGIESLVVGQGPELEALGAVNAAEAAKARAENKKPPPPIVADSGPPGRGVLAKAKRQIDHLVSHVGTNPRVPLSSCSASGYDPHAPDVLMPIRLRDFTANQSALAGHVTLVGKVMHVVHGPAQDYVDLASLRQWSGADFWTNGHEAGLQEDGLGADATVLAPGYVIQPVAIYK